MRKDNYMLVLFAGVAALFFTDHSVTSAADKVVVIPLSKATTTTCTAPDEVRSAGHCWKDRNLGASQVATSSTDSDAYGDLYQWGRLRDGHQHRTSDELLVNIANSANDVPGHNDFITTGNIAPFDWRNPQNNNLWQGLGGVNNPCPQGFRLPTETELNAERISWTGGDNATGAFESPLHIVVAGFRSFLGDLGGIDSNGCYWSSTTVESNGIYLSRYLNIHDAGVAMSSFKRAGGLSVRCIKD